MSVEVAFIIAFAFGLIVWGLCAILDHLEIDDD